MPTTPSPRAASPTLVAHRGAARRYPENTIASLRAALDAGAAWIEFDVQMTADGVPVLLHDETLRRTAGRDGRVHDLTRAELDVVDVGEVARFGDAFAGTRLPDLREAVALIMEWPERRAFVELKQHSLARFGVADVLDRVARVLAPVRDRCVVISFDRAAIELARELGHQIGWVLDAWNDRVRDQATVLAPEYIFCDTARLPPAPEPLWPGPWRWAVYEVTAPSEATALAQRGVDLVETMAIIEMLGHFP